jgi:hypothetical protein
MDFQGRVAAMRTFLPFAPCAHDPSLFQNNRHGGREAAVRCGLQAPVCGACPLTPEQL